MWDFLDENNEEKRELIKIYRAYRKTQVPFDKIKFDREYFLVYVMDSSVATRFRCRLSRVIGHDIQDLEVVKTRVLAGPKYNGSMHLYLLDDEENNDPVACQSKTYGRSWRLFNIYKL